MNPTEPQREKAIAFSQRVENALASWPNPYVRLGKTSRNTYWVRDAGGYISYSGPLSLLTTKKPLPWAMRPSNMAVWYEMDVAPGTDLYYATMETTDPTDYRERALLLSSIGVDISRYCGALKSGIIKRSSGQQLRAIFDGLQYDVAHFDYNFLVHYGIRHKDKEHPERIIRSFRDFVTNQGADTYGAVRYLRDLCDKLQYAFQREYIASALLWHLWSTAPPGGRVARTFASQEVEKITDYVSSRRDLLYSSWRDKVEIQRQKLEQQLKDPRKRVKALDKLVELRKQEFVLDNLEKQMEEAEKEGQTKEKRGIQMAILDTILNIEAAFFLDAYGEHQSRVVRYTELRQGDYVSLADAELEMERNMRSRFRTRHLVSPQETEFIILLEGQKRDREKAELEAQERAKEALASAALVEEFRKASIGEGFAGEKRGSPTGRVLPLAHNNKLCIEECRKGPTGRCWCPTGGGFYGWKGWGYCDERECENESVVASSSSLTGS